MLRKARKVDIVRPKLSNGVCLMALLGDDIRDVVPSCDLLSIVLGGATPER